MKLRLVRRYKAIHIYCPNGTILNPTEDDIIKLLTSFKKPNQFKGNDGFWNNEIADIENAPGETLAYVDDTNKLVILNESVFDGLLKETMSYVSANEYADMHGKGKAIVKKLCLEGRIQGAQKHSTGWLIPKDAPYPKDKRRADKRSRSKQTTVNNMQH